MSDRGVTFLKGDEQKPSISKSNTTSDIQGTKGSGSGPGMTFTDKGATALKLGDIGSTGASQKSVPSGKGEVQFAKGEDSK